LIVLDNARDSGQVIPLLPGSSSCMVLITSREHLTGLVTAHGAHPLPLDVLDDASARELLVRRLGPARVNAEPEAVDQLVGYCAGLPLALGIVAAHAATHADFPLVVLSAELGETSARLDALDGMELNSNLRAVLSWSYQALEPETAEMFRLLGVAPGPDISGQAAAVLAGLPTEAVVRRLRLLEKAHLVQRYQPTRYRMHDLVRLYAADRAAADGPPGSDAEALSRLLSFYLHASYAGERMLYPHRKKIDIGASPVDFDSPEFTDDTSILKWFDVEHACLVAAQAAAMKRGWHELVWQLAWTLHGFLWRRGHLQERMMTWRAGLRATQQLDNPAIEGLAHRLLGQAYAMARRDIEAKEHLYQALDLARKTGDTHGEARAFYDLTLVWRDTDNEMALKHATEAFRLFRNLDSPVWEAEALDMMGKHQAKLGLYKEAEASCSQAFDLFRRSGNRQGEAVTLDSLGYIAHHSGRYDEALSYFHRSLALCRDLGATYYEADTQDHLGHAYSALGRLSEARRAWRRALTLNRAQHRAADADRIQQQLELLDWEAS
jgi:tetratricopeptide (TPR) repeat protein